MENNEINYEALRAQQVADLQSGGGSPMGLHHYCAVIGGLPPGTRCIVTPEVFKTQCDTGMVPENHKPLNQLEATLHEFVGPQQNISLKFSFNSSNPAENQPSSLSPTLANLFNPLNPV